MDFLAKTIKCMVRQDSPVGVINVYLNNYKAIPWFCNHPKVNAVLAPEGDLGASGKFYFLDKFEGLYLTCDDDLNYLPDYTSRIIKALEEYNYKVVVGFHGTSYGTFPIKSYYHDQKQRHHYASALDKNTFVDMLGTGTMAFHTDLKVPRDIFQERNMCDPQMMKWLIENDIPQLCLARPKLFIADHRNSQKGACIWKECAYRGDQAQTDIVNSINNYRIISHGM